MQVTATKPYFPRVLVDDITGNTFRYYGYGAGSRIDLLQHDITKPVYDIKWLCELAADLMTWHFEDIHVDNHTTLSY